MTLLRSPPKLDAATLVGKWSATDAEKTRFDLNLTKDGSFTWTYTLKNKPQTVKGVYALDGGVLAMEPESGGTMLAEATPPKGGSFDFKLLGAPPGDAGLKFAQSR